MKEPGIYTPGIRRMRTQEIDPPLRLEALHRIERGVRGKLRALNLSDSFIERCLEDSIQKGLVEYLRKLDQGEVIENRNGFVVRAAFLRAIDELRREARQADGAVVDLLINSGSVAEPPSEELAIEYLQAEELREAVQQLSPEEQQVLSLHYFEEKTAEASAEALFCSERTYRRRLKQTLRKLGQMLDTPVPEPGSELAIEIGVITWVVLRGAKVPISQGPLEHLVRFAEGLVGRTGGSENTERVVAVAGSGPAKVVGGCAAAVAACVLAVGGAELAGVGNGVSDHPRQGHRTPIQRTEPNPEQRVVAAPPAPSSYSSGRSADSESPTSSASSAKKREREANQEVNTQGTGALVPEEATASEPTPESAPVESSSPPPSSPNAAAESQGAAGLVQP